MRKWHITLRNLSAFIIVATLAACSSNNSGKLAGGSFKSARLCSIGDMAFCASCTTAGDTTVLDKDACHGMQLATDVFCIQQAEILGQSPTISSSPAPCSQSTASDVYCINTVDYTAGKKSYHLSFAEYGTGTIPILVDVYFNAIAYGNKTFVAVGDTGAIQTSTNGSLWKKQHRDESDYIDFSGIAYGKGMFVAVGRGQHNCKIRTSVDGSSWQSQQPGECSGKSFFAITYNNDQGTFVAVGHNVIQTSVDGSYWENRNKDGSDNIVFRGIAYGENTFVAVGLNTNSQTCCIQTSVDGSSWQSQKPADCNKSLDSIVYNNDDSIFVAAGASGIQTSVDGSSWEHRHKDTSDDIYFSGVAHSKNTYAAVGYNSTNRRGEIQISSDGSIWHTLNAANSELTDKFLGAVTYDDGKFIAVGGDIIITSTDGSHWTSQIPASNNPCIAQIGDTNASFSCLNTNTSACYTVAQHHNADGPQNCSDDLQDDTPWKDDFSQVDKCPSSQQQCEVVFTAQDHEDGNNSARFSLACYGPASACEFQFNDSKSQGLCVYNVTDIIDDIINLDAIKNVVDIPFF